MSPCAIRVHSKWPSGQMNAEILRARIQLKSVQWAHRLVGSDRQDEDGGLFGGHDQRRGISAGRGHVDHHIVAGGVWLGDDKPGATVRRGHRIGDHGRRCSLRADDQLPARSANHCADRRRLSDSRSGGGRPVKILDAKSVRPQTRLAVFPQRPQNLGSDNSSAIAGEYNGQQSGDSGEFRTTARGAQYRSSRH